MFSVYALWFSANTTQHVNANIECAWLGNHVTLRCDSIHGVRHM